jgi:dUTP pyrophosphatase
MTPELYFKRLHPQAAMPSRATPGSAGLDLAARLDSPLVIPARGRAVVGTGLAAEMPQGTVGLVFGRSGLGIKHGITPANAVGVIDSDYRGEIMVGLANPSDESYTVEPGDRIAQLVLVPAVMAEPAEKEELAETGRGEGGFGSTGGR